MGSVSTHSCYDRSLSHILPFTPPHSFSPHSLIHSRSLPAFASPPFTASLAARAILPNGPFGFLSNSLGLPFSTNRPLSNTNSVSMSMIVSILGVIMIHLLQIMVYTVHEFLWSFLFTYAQ